jgi:hypothetical protein
LEANVTGSLELAVAVSASGGERNAIGPGAANVIDCGAGVTVKVCVTGAAGLKFAFPLWLAVMEHEPAPTIAIVIPATVHTAGVFETIVSGKPELAVAFTESGEDRKATDANAPSEIDCGAGVTVNACVTGAAASCVASPV